MSNNNDSSQSRRTFMKWASTVGIAGLAPDTVAEIAEARRTRATEDRPIPEPVPDDERGDLTAPVELEHYLDMGSVRDRVSAYEDSGRPEDLYKGPLRRFLDRSTGDDRIPIAVKTVGQRNSIVTNGPYQRQIKGWQPTRSEVRDLSAFGSVEHVPEFISTTVSMRDVHVDDLSDVATLPFVLSVNYDPAPEPASFDKDYLRGDDAYGFTWVEADYDIDWPTKVAILDDGYSDGHGNYAENHAAEIGHSIVSRDFTDEDDWSSVTYEQGGNRIYHGTTVADSLGYMIDPDHGARTHDKLFCHMKVASEEQGYWSSNVREAIEHAARNDVEVLNMSFGSFEDKYCPSRYCDELKSYAAAGYVAVAATGNDGKTDGANHPACSAWTIGVGGIGSSCSNSADFERHEDSNYGYVGTGYYDNSNYVVECDECYELEGVGLNFYPDVYACYATETDAGEIAGGTSNATPQAAAAALIMQNNGVGDYPTAKDLFQEMDYDTICPDLAAMNGQLLDAVDAYHRTN